MRRGDNLVAVVGSGGGLRGIGELLGMYEVLAVHLLSEGKDVGAVAGTSAGSFAGAVLAMEPTLGGIRQAQRTYLEVSKTDVFGVFADIRMALRTAFTRHVNENAFDSLVPTGQYRKFLRGILGAGTLIENLPVPYVAVAADLLSGDVFEIDRGPLWPAVYASTSQWPYLSPLPHDDDGRWRYLTDGGVARHVPIESVLRFTPGEIWACFVSTTGQTDIDGVRGLANIGKRCADIALAQNIERSFEVARDDRDGIDTHLVIARDMPGSDSFMDFDHRDEFIDHGRKTMLEYISDPKPTRRRFSGMRSGTEK